VCLKDETTSGRRNMLKITGESNCLSFWRRQTLFLFQKTVLYRDNLCVGVCACCCVFASLEERKKSSCWFVVHHTNQHVSCPACLCCRLRVNGFTGSDWGVKRRRRSVCRVKIGHKHTTESELQQVLSPHLDMKTNWFVLFLKLHDLVSVNLSLMRWSKLVS